MIVSRSSRIFFDSAESAAQGLLTTLEDARVSEYNYRFGPTVFSQVYASGLVLEGEIQEVLNKIEKIDGATRFDD